LSPPLPIVARPAGLSTSVFSDPLHPLSFQTPSHPHSSSAHSKELARLVSDGPLLAAIQGRCVITAEK